MPFYRVKQFWWSLISSIDENDIKYLNLHLTDVEKSLFMRLKKSEQKHCINVAKDVEQMCFHKNAKYDRLIKVALLHDIGKIQNRLTIFDKSIIVILDYISKGKLRKLKNIKKVNVYYNHGEIGAKILKGYGYEQRFLYLIENHHNKNIENDEELDIIRNCDDRH